MLYLYDNQSLLKAINRWIGEGGKVIGASDTDISAAAIVITVKENCIKNSNSVGQNESASRNPSAAYDGAQILAIKANLDPKVSKTW